MVSEFPSQQVIITLVLVGFAGCVSFIVVACNLMKRHYPHDGASGWIVVAAAFAVFPVLSIGVALFAWLTLCNDLHAYRRREALKRKQEEAFRLWYEKHSRH